MRERRDFMAKAADELASLGVERTDFGGTFYSPLAFPGLVGEPFDRLRHGVREKAVVRDSVDAFEFLLAGGVGGIPFVAFTGGREGRRALRHVAAALVRLEGREGARRLHRPRARDARRSRRGSGRARRPTSASPATGHEGVWESVCTAERYDALDGLDAKAFAAARQRFLQDPRHEALRLTGTKHPDSTAHRAEQLERALARRRRGRRAAPAPPSRTSSGTR